MLYYWFSKFQKKILSVRASFVIDTTQYSKRIISVKVYNKPFLLLLDLISEFYYNNKAIKIKNSIILTKQGLL